MTRFTWDKQLAKRRAAFALLVVLAALLQSTKGVLPVISGARAFLMVPLCMAIAMTETAVAAMLFGVLGGVLLDICSAGGDGFFAVTLCVLCFVCSTLVSFCFQNNLPACLLLNAAALLVCISAHWVLFVLFKGYEGAGGIFLHHYLAGAFYSLLFAPLAFWLVRAIKRALPARQ